MGLDQDEAILDNDNEEIYSTCFTMMVAIEDELKSREGDQRRALSRSPSIAIAKIRLNAAKATLAGVPESLSVIQALAESGELPQAGDAGMTLRALDEGIFKPTLSKCPRAVGGLDTRNLTESAQLAGKPGHDGGACARMTSPASNEDRERGSDDEQSNDRSDRDQSEFRRNAGGCGGNAYDDLVRAFEAFKAQNDERIQTIEKRMPVDVLTTEKLDRINRAVDESKSIVDQLVLKSARPQLGGGASVPQHDAAAAQGRVRGLRPSRRGAWIARAGSEGALGRLGRRWRLSGAAGTEAAVNRGAKNISPIRAIAGNRTVSANVYKKPFSITGPATGWVAETATRPETNSPTLAELDLPDHRALRHAVGDAELCSTIPR